MTIIFSIITLVYIGCISGLVYGFLKLQEYKSNGEIPQVKFSIVVPFRNEAENLPHLLESFSKLDYPVDLFEVILVDDDSNDGFEIGDFRFEISVIKNIRISNSPKKDAISTAISQAKNDWIITTDADCTFPPEWLKTLSTFILEKKAEMVAGAIKYETGNSFLHHFQQLDIASLQGATIGSFGIGKPFMCNGANFAYSKQFFRKLGGFDGNNTMASGDDVFLLQKAVKRFSEKVFYLKSENFAVATKPAQTWKYLFFQRVRWASKASSYENGFGKILGVIVFAGNLTWIIGLLLLTFEGFPWQFAGFILGKILVDFILIYISNRFLKVNTRYFLLASLLYPFFSVIVALYPVFGKYEWKGRKFRK